MKEIFLFGACLLFSLGVMTLPGTEAFGQPAAPPPSPQEPAVENKDQNAQVQALLEGARLSGERGEVDAAITTLQDLINRFPDSPAIPEAYLRLGELFSEKGNPPQAIEAFRAILEKFPASTLLPEARYHLALSYLAVQDPASADTLFESVAGQEDQKLDIYRKSAEVFFRQGDFFNGIVQLQKELPLLQSPERESIRALISRTVQDRLKEKDLQELAQRFPRSFPGDDAEIRLIEMYFGQDDYYKAGREINQFTSRFPAHPYAQRTVFLMAEMKKRLKSNRILLAALLPLSGRLSYFGTSALNGIRLALQQYKEGAGGQSVGLLVEDTEEEKGRLKQAVEELLSEYHPAALIGPLLSHEVEQVAAVAERNAIPLITPGASNANLIRGSKYLFRDALTGRAQSLWVAQYAMTTLPQKRFVILYPRDSYGEELMRVFSAEVLRLGGEVIDSESYPPEESDFGVEIRKIKEVDLKKYGHLEPVELVDDAKRRREFEYHPGFDGVYVIGDSEKVGLILPQLAFYDVHNVAFFGNSGWDSEQLLSLAGRFAEGGVFVDGFFIESPDAAVHEFVTLYRRKYQEDPNLFAAQAYDAAKIVLDTIKKGAADPVKIREALLSTKDFPGASGLTTFLPDGEAEKKPFLIQVKNGKFVQIN